MKEQESVYGQLALDFGAAIAPDDPGRGDCKIIPISAARTALQAVKKQGARRQSEFSAFFKDHIPFAGRLLRCFDNMEEAEKQIYQGFVRYPDKAFVIDRIFPALYTTEVLSTIGHDLYVAHMRALVNRVGEGHEDLTIATDAEVIAAIHGITLITPTKKFVGQAYWHLFQKMMPRQAAGLAGDMAIFEIPAYEHDREQVFDFIEGIRKKLRIQDRKLSDLNRRAYRYSLSLRRFYTEYPQHAPVGFKALEVAI